MRETIIQFTCHPHCHWNNRVCPPPPKGDKFLADNLKSSGFFVIGIIAVLVVLHLRRRKRDKREWTKDPQELDDYGLGTNTAISSVKVQQQTHNSNNNTFTGTLDSQVKQGGPDVRMPSLGVPNNRSTADDTSSLARSVQHNENPFASKAQTPHSMV